RPNHEDVIEFAASAGRPGMHPEVLNVRRTPIGMRVRGDKAADARRDDLQRHEILPGASAAQYPPPSRGATRPNARVGWHNPAHRARRIAEQGSSMTRMRLAIAAVAGAIVLVTAGGALLALRTFGVHAKTVELTGWADTVCKAQAVYSQTFINALD